MSAEENIIRAVIRGLAGVSGAPWGTRVFNTTTSDVVEVSGANAGNPVATTWPLVMFSASIAEHRNRTLPGATYLANFDEDARTVERRRAPRFVNITFRVRVQTRSGVNTGAGPSAQSAPQQLFACMKLIEDWIDDHGAFEGAVLQRIDPMTPSPSNRARPADVFQAEGAFRVDWIAVPVGTPQVLPADNELDVDTAAQRTLP